MISYKVQKTKPNQTKTKPKSNQTKQNQTKQNQTKQNKTKQKQNKTKQKTKKNKKNPKKNKTKQNKTQKFGCTKCLTTCLNHRDQKKELLSIYFKFRFFCLLIHMTRIEAGFMYKYPPKVLFMYFDTRW